MVLVCEVGRRYYARGRYWTLQEHFVGAIEKALRPPPDGLAGWAPDGDGGDLLALPAYWEALERWRAEALRICKAHAGEHADVGVFLINSAYRRLGTTAGSGAYADPCGAIDSNDQYGGHFSGRCADIPTRFFRESCIPVLTVDEVNVAARRAGLFRPWINSGEWWHYTLRSTR